MPGLGCPAKPANWQNTSARQSRQPEPGSLPGDGCPAKPANWQTGARQFVRGRGCGGPLCQVIQAGCAQSGESGECYSRESRQPGKKPPGSLTWQRAPPEICQPRPGKTGKSAQHHIFHSTALKTSNVPVCQICQDFWHAHFGMCQNVSHAHFGKRASVPDVNFWHAHFWQRAPRCLSGTHFWPRASVPDALSSIALPKPP